MLASRGLYTRRVVDRDREIGPGGEVVFLETQDQCRTHICGLGETMDLLLVPRATQDCEDAGPIGHRIS